MMEELGVEEIGGLDAVATMSNIASLLRELEKTVKFFGYKSLKQIKMIEEN